MRQFQQFRDDLDGETLLNISYEYYINFKIQDFAIILLFLTSSTCHWHGQTMIFFFLCGMEFRFLRICTGHFSCTLAGHRRHSHWSVYDPSDDSFDSLPVYDRTNIDYYCGHKTYLWSENDVLACVLWIFRKCLLLVIFFPFEILNSIVL